jgi:calmodulin
LEGNGLLDFSEFLHMMESRASSVRRQSPDAEMRALFAAFDKDGNGYIDASELRSTMHDVGLELTDSDIDLMMKVAGVAIKDRIFYEGRIVCFAIP